MSQPNPTSLGRVLTCTPDPEVPGGYRVTFTLVPPAAAASSSALLVAATPAAATPERNLLNDPTGHKKKALELYRHTPHPDAAIICGHTDHVQVATGGAWVTARLWVPDSFGLPE